MSAIQPSLNPRSIVLDSSGVQDIKLTYQVDRFSDLQGWWLQLHTLLDACYPNPPKDVFFRVIEQYRVGFPVWIASDGSSLLGCVMLAPNSKGGTLETLAVSPEYRHQGIAHTLVQSLLAEVSGVVSLTTRIPSFFEPFGFQFGASLPDGSTFMFCITPK